MSLTSIKWVCWTEFKDGEVNRCNLVKKENNNNNLK